jgi:hypothetical protein
MSVMMRQTLVALALLLLPLGSASTAPAPSAPSEVAKAMVGKWEFADASGDRKCSITFRTDPGAVGMRLEFDQTCFGLFPFIKEIVGWRYAEGDFLRMFNARGKSVLEFSEGGEVGNRMFEAPRPGEGILRIQEIGAAIPNIKPEQVAGDWTMMRSSGRVLCTLTLTSNPVGESFALKLNPGCDASTLQLVSWRIERGGIVLASSRGETWLFDADDIANWHRIPQSADPILLIRKQ